MTRRADKPLKIVVKDDVLTIEIGVNTLAYAAEIGPFIDFQEKTGSYTRGWRVTDRREFARDVAAALGHEDDVGATGLGRLLDQAAAKAWEDGSLGVEVDGETTFDDVEREWGVK